MNAAGRRTIVVIDDEEEIRRVLSALLQEAGHEVVTCGDPLTAVDVVAAAEPDLVLCDISMPGCDGYEVLRRLQLDPRTAPYPVVFLTARSEFSERVRAFRYGAVDFMSKPFTREILLRRVERILKELEARAGAVAEPGAGADGLLEDVQREARSGVLTLATPAGEQRVVLAAGKVVEGQMAGAGGESARLPGAVEFRELDLRREGIVSHEPSSLAGDVGDVPNFRALPEALRSVLVVDDNAAFREFLTRLLSRQGLSVRQAVDGEQALRLALVERPWLIVTDTRMPRVDGFELCRRVRAHSLIAHTPIVFLSGWDDYKSRYRALELGADEYVSKASPLRELLLRLHLTLGRYAALGARGGEGRMRGGLDAVGIVGLLQMCHLTRLTGLLSLRSAAQLVELRFCAGEVVGAVSGELSGTAVVYEALGWTRGYFDFVPCAVPAGEPLDGFTHLILEGCRLLDERRQQRT